MSQKCFKFTFFAFIDSLKLNLKFPCTISIIWKRGEKLAEVKQRKQIVNGTATFNQQLSIECNMIFDTQKKHFQSKKTIFSILIFTDKGTKQAGEIEIDVAELLNNKSQQKEYDCGLLKCPDKNAKLLFKIKPSFKEQIKVDAVSQRSLKTVDVEKVAGTINIAEANFKKKRKVVEEEGWLKQPIEVTGKTEVEISYSQQDVKELTEQNKRLKEGVKQAKKEIDKIKKSIENSQGIAIQEKKKCKEYQIEINRLKQISKDFSNVEQENRGLENEVLICKLKLAEIFNKAFELGGPNLVDRLQEACGYTENAELTN